MTEAEVMALYEKRYQARVSLNIINSVWFSQTVASQLKAEKDARRAGNTQHSGFVYHNVSFRIF